MNSEAAPLTPTGIAIGNKALHTPREVADRAIDQKHSIGKSRILPIKLKVIEDLKSQKIHIFNVGPWSQTVNTGSTGTFNIPACKQGEDYAEMLVLNSVTGEWEPPISVIMEEYVIKSEDEMSSLTEDGWNFAQSMLGIGRGQHPARSLVRFGIFATRNATPTSDELKNAHLALEEECRQIVKWAGDIYATDRKLFARAVRPEVHFVAARILGRDNPQDSPWMIDANPIGRVKCKMCGRLCDPDVATCEAGHVVNMELYLELQAADEQLRKAIEGSEKRGPGRPRKES
jgi:hypothetical protein